MPGTPDDEIETIPDRVSALAEIVNQIARPAGPESIRRLMEGVGQPMVNLQKANFLHKDLFGQGSALAAITRATDFARILPKSIQLPTFAVSSEVTRLLAGSTAWGAVSEARRITSLLESSQMATFASRQGFDQTDNLVRQMAGLSSELSRTLRLVSASNLDFGLQRPVEFSARAWRIVVEDLPLSFAETAFGRVASAGAETLATAHAVALLGGASPEFDVPDPDKGKVALPTTVRAELRTRLSNLDPNLVRRLDGAWERVGATGDDATSQACHSVQELLDWTLRLAAPDTAVLEWHQAERREPKELHDGKPTRVLRANFMLRHRPTESKAARLYLRSINDVVEVLQAGKHGLEQAHTPHAVGCFLVTVESLLAFLLFDR